MTKSDGGKQRNIQPTNGGAAAVAVAVAAARQRDGSAVAAHSTTAAVRRWQREQGVG